jgi:hypothetical protein
MFSRRQSIVLVSFLLMASAVWGLERYLSGGSNAVILGNALAKLKATRHFAGSVSVVAAVPIKGAGREAVITMAKGRFGLPPGKTLVGAWTLTVRGASDDAVADLAEIDMAVPGDGKIYLRPKQVSDALGLNLFPKGTAGTWVTMPASVLWTAPAAVPIDAAASWQGLFDALVAGEDLLVTSREIGESVAGEPCWHFALGLQSSSVGTYGITFERLRLGRDLTAKEKQTMEENFTANAPAIDLWVAKRSGELRQAVLSYISQTEGQTPQPVVVTAQFASYPPYEPVLNPLATAGETTASAPRP